LDKKAFFKLSYGLYILSTCWQDKQNGCVINTAVQVTSSPACISVAVSKDNYTNELIKNSKVFVVTALSKNADMKLISEFGFKSGRDVDKFKSFNTNITENGIKYVTDDIVSVFNCKVINSVDMGTHTIFVGEVTDAKILRDEEALTYEYYHKVKKGTTPKNAPSYSETEEYGFRCSVCGHIEKAEALPDDFICPVCKQGKDKFVKIGS